MRELRRIGREAEWTILFFSIEWLAIGRGLDALLWVRKVGERWIPCGGAEPIVFRRIMVVFVRLMVGLITAHVRFSCMVIAGGVSAEESHLTLPSGCESRR